LLRGHEWKEGVNERNKTRGKGKIVTVDEKTTRDTNKNVNKIVKSFCKILGLRIGLKPMNIMKRSKCTQCHKKDNVRLMV
jgi:hypothetical protein